MLFKPAALAAFAGLAAATAIVQPAPVARDDGGYVYGDLRGSYPGPDEYGDDGDDCPTPPKGNGGFVSTSTSSSAPATTTTSTSTISRPFWATAYTATATDEIAAAAATAKTSSNTSNVKGAAFDRILIIIFENTDADVAYADPNFAHFASQGVTLTNQYGCTHPSQPNYMAAVMGDYFGCDNDNMQFVEEKVSTIVDLLEEGGVSWSSYEEDLPHSGAEGFSYPNPITNKTADVRKHSAVKLADSVAGNEERLSNIKNISFIDPESSMFHKDLASNQLSQWMWMSPNMTSDAHDSNVTVAGNWLRNFFDNLVLKDESFMDNTIVFITFDENDTQDKDNLIAGILFGDALPAEYRGTKDAGFYNHYSMIASVTANWNLHTLGRNDVGANVWKFVGDKTGDKVREWDNTLGPVPLFNNSYAGPLNVGTGNKQYAAPNLNLKTPTGRTVSPKIKQMWENSDAPTYYHNAVNIYTGQFPPQGYKPDSLSRS